MFSTPDYKEYIQLIGSFSSKMILVSVLVIAFASYTTLVLYERMLKPSFFKREVWLLLASLALSFGIWATHFLAMNSLLLPVEMHVHYGWAFICIVPIFFATLLAFQLVRSPMKACWRHAVGAALIAQGMSAMQYLGMKAMMVDALIVYDWKLLIAGNLIGGLLVYLALREISNPRGISLSLAFVMFFLTVGTLSLHYLGIFGTNYYIEEGQALRESVMHMEIMNALIGVGVGLLLLGMLLTSYIDRYVDYWLRYYDVLTKLPNRRNWERCLAEDVTTGGVAIWNFPDLPRINQLYGYTEGDIILKQIGALLAKWKPSYAQLYRVSGNRFLLCVEHTGRTTDFYKNLVIMQSEMDQLLPIKSQEMRYACGLAQADQNKSVKTLYKEALMVVEQAAASHEWGLLTFDPVIHGKSYEQDVLRDISEALDERHIYLVYQPKVKGATHEFVGVEALLRWTHPELGSIPPATFVPILEQEGRMGEVTDWIIREVCRQIHNWDSQGIRVPQVAINIPGEYVTEPSLLNLLWKETNAYRLDPSRIELEITETSTAKSTTQAIAAMKQFRRYGFSIALDDFGTGVSSLSFLQQMPITTLKIDKSFTDGVPAPAKKSAVLNAIIAIGCSMDLTIVVEGVERLEQVEFLLDLKSDLTFQGYYFSKPLTVPQFENWLADSNKLGFVHP
ncbi:putative bifunctional diguanylate cyclase/phosphodiesterase [Sporosarcina ureae]|uniref:putative bifunctional diguanylate cyclase/phosphodiesterase n=1 Tax=Sporosarcina ureae TaxID=1571 RepID=UPI0028AE693B|nr:EAL domain-containing protein [Sporosarcina ureae]